MLDQKGEGAGIYLRFKTEENEAIEIKAGFSYTSAANALANLNAEAENLTFDEALSTATKTWEDELSKIIYR